ncbi:hypothetical protein FQR65_LT00634 [Abscondita terminalis]|nr:hypothetical protein FQR65_LT00634 [Abscondita terminalis]
MKLTKINKVISNLFNEVNCTNCNLDSIRLIRPENVANFTKEIFVNFNLDTTITTENILTSELYFFGMKWMNNTPVIIRLYGCYQRTPGVKTRRLLAVTYMTNTKQEYEVFNVKSSVKELEDARTIQFSLTLSYSNDTLVEFSIDECFLVLKLISSNLHQHQQQELLNANALPSTCQLVSHAINNTSTILLPKDFTINVCSGFCANNISDLTNHVKFLRVFNIKITPCCVPRWYLPLTIAYCDKYDNVVIRKYFNANAVSCECR